MEILYITTERSHEIVRRNASFPIEIQYNSIPLYRNNR